jgi:hypothetical protein
VDFFSRQLQPLERAADGGDVGRLAQGLGHLTERGIRALLDEPTGLRLVVVVVETLIRELGLGGRDRSQFASALHEASHARGSATHHLGDLARRHSFVVQSHHALAKVHRIRRHGF